MSEVLKMDIQKIFEITNWIDEARWQPSNYNSINYYRNDLSSNVKILTHWISYITDRQMPFKSIWEIGGFVFSNLVDKIIEYKENADIIEELLNPTCDESFFLSRENYQKINSNFKIKNDDDSKKFLFVADVNTGNNEILKENGFSAQTRPYFISRFYPSDYYSILSTFYILKDFDFQLAKYLQPIIEKSSEKDIIKRILFALYLLSYHDIGKPIQEDLMNFNKIKKKTITRKEKILKILNSEKNFKNEYDIFINSDKIYQQKRAWCSLRDYCKSSFKSDFIDILKKEELSLVAKLFEKDRNLRSELFKQFELPGDVWNNNDKFRKCIFTDNGFEKKIKLTRLLRQIYEQNEIPVGYPEQFDMTFDFAPRMCEQSGNCKICPYGKLKGIADDFEKLCIKDENKFCPIAVVCGNYRILCKGQECALLKY